MGKHSKSTITHSESARAIVKTRIRYLLAGFVVAIALALALMISTITRDRSLDSPHVEILPSINIGSLTRVTPETAQSSAPAATPFLKFEGPQAFRHVRSLTSIGSRVSGSDQEGAAADYIEYALAQAGFTARRQSFTAPNGRTVENVIGEKQGVTLETSETYRSVAIGAHYDTVADTSGANDNASGVAVILELARIMGGADLPYNLSLVLFSSEENENPDRDSYSGSLAYVRALTETEKAVMIGYINLDMVGWPGAGYSIGNLHVANPSMIDLGVALANERGLSFVKDRGYSIRRSDHQSFEKAGIPTVSFGAAAYPYHHKPADSLDKITPERLEGIGSLVAAMLRKL